MTDPLIGRISRATCLLAAASGVLWVLALPPMGAWWLAPASVAILLLALRDQAAPGRALVGLIAGLVAFGVTLRWSATFTIPGYVILTIVQSCFVSLSTLLVPARRPGALIALPASLVVSAWLRNQWPLSGLPLSGLDLTQASSPLLSLAALGGPLLLTLAAAGLGSLVVVGFSSRPVRIRLAATVAGMTLLLTASLLPTDIGTRPEGTITVATVQGGGPRGIPAIRSDESLVFERQVRANAAVRAPVDLVLWPEDVIDVDGSFVGSPEQRRVSMLAAALDAVLIVGVVEDAEPVRQGSPNMPRRFLNRAYVIGSGGRVGQAYDKVIRVPFGEYVPWRSLVARFADLSLIPREAVGGSGPGIVPTSLGVVGVSVSFEGLFATRARGAVNGGAQLLVNPTNASSYVTADIPAQQLAAGRLRAMETGRSVLIAAPTGPSAIIDADGRVLSSSSLGEQDVLEGRVSLRSGRTPYAVTGDWPTLALSGVLLLLAWTRRRVDWALVPRHLGRSVDGPSTPGPSSARRIRS